MSTDDLQPRAMGAVRMRISTAPSKSAVSRRFVAIAPHAKLEALASATPHDSLVALLRPQVAASTRVPLGGIDCIVVALDLDHPGREHTLGRVGLASTENTTVCQGLLTNLHSRGLRTDRSLPGRPVTRWGEGARRRR